MSKFDKRMYPETISFFNATRGVMQWDIFYFYELRKGCGRKNQALYRTKIGWTVTYEEAQDTRLRWGKYAPNQHQK